MTDSTLTLQDIGSRFCSDKFTVHNYAPQYEFHFEKIRFNPIQLLEIGIGGDSHTDQGGASLKTWEAYFPQATVSGIDIFEKTNLATERIQVFMGDQADAQFLKSVHQKTGDFDIVIDDGSHRSVDVISSFEILFPLLKIGGIYVIEDLQTSYWKKWGGSRLRDANTTMNYLKQLSDGLNYAEFEEPGYRATYFDRYIASMHFYHNIVFIYKGINNAGSCFLVNNVWPVETV